MNWAQKIYKLLRPRNLFRYGPALPFFNFFYLPKINRYHVMRICIILFGVIPAIGFFRRPYMRGKFQKQLANQTQSKEIQLKESLSKFQITIPPEKQYMVIISYSTLNDENLSSVDQENCRKIYTLYQDQKSLGAAGQEIKWVFFGNENVYELLKQGGFDMEFHNMNRMRRQAKVYLIGRDEEGEQKVVTEWQIGVPIESITKSISKHRYKKFIKSVNF